MTDPLHTSILLLIVLSIVAANLPWLNERFLLILKPPGGQAKTLWMRLLEWFIFLILFILASFGVEKKLMGEIYSQDWEFYVVMVCLFVVFALPGFIYRHDLRPHLDKRLRRDK